MSKIVYVQRPEGIEPPQHPLTDESEVQAWIQYMFHAGVWEALRLIRFV
jgi:hypothetical protein